MSKTPRDRLLDVVRSPHGNQAQNKKAIRALVASLCEATGTPPVRVDLGNMGTLITPNGARTTTSIDDAAAQWALINYRGDRPFSGGNWTAWLTVKWDEPRIQLTRRNRNGPLYPPALLAYTAIHEFGHHHAYYKTGADAGHGPDWRLSCVLTAAILDIPYDPQRRLALPGEIGLMLLALGAA
jgi:hypothetical protein